MKKNKRMLYPILVLGLIVFIGGVLRFYGLSQKSLWIDEVASVRDSETIAHVMNGAQPPLYYFILYLFRYTGTTEFTLRLPSAIFGVLTIALSYMVGKLFFGSKEGLVCAFLLSISTFDVYYSQEARMYALLTFLSLSSLFFFYKSIKENRKTLWFGFVSSTILALYTHYFGFFVLFVEIAFFAILAIKNQFSMKTKLSKLRKRTFIMFALSVMIIFLLCAPLAYLRLNVIIGRLAPATSEDSGLSVPPLESSFLFKLFGEFSGGSPLSYGGPVIYLFMLFFMCGCVLSIKKFKEELAMLLLWIAIPIVLLFLASTRILIWSEPRYLIYVLPVYLLVISKGITTLPVYLLLVISKGITSVKSLSPHALAKDAKIYSVAICLIITLFISASVPSLLGYYSQEKRDWRGVAQYLETKSQPGDVIIVEPSYAMMPFSYYFVNPKNVTIERIYNSLRALERIYDKNSRVWFVGGGRVEGEIMDWLNRKYLWQEDFGRGLRIFFLFRSQLIRFRAAVFGNFQSFSDHITRWEATLASIGASVTTFDDTTIISTVNMSQFDLAVFADIKRPINNGERLYLQESVKNGLNIIVSGLSPYWLAGGTTDLTQISAWFGATAFYEAPPEARWKVKFTTDATKIMKNLDADREYTFYTGSDWSTPTGVLAQPETVVYAYRVDDGSATIFSHAVGNGTSMFNGVRYGFESPDADVFQPFLQAMVLSVIG